MVFLELTPPLPGASKLYYASTNEKEMRADVAEICAVRRGSLTFRTMSDEEVEQLLEKMVFLELTRPEPETQKLYYVGTGEKEILADAAELYGMKQEDFTVRVMEYKDAKQLLAQGNTPEERTAHLKSFVYATSAVARAQGKKIWHLELPNRYQRPEAA